MKVKDLIKKLQQTGGDNEVFIDTEKGMHSFSIVSFDDVGDASLCIAEGDELA